MRVSEPPAIPLRQSKYFLLVSFSIGVCKGSRSSVKLSAQNIYTWSNTPLGTTKVVILGQGRYVYTILLIFRRLTDHNLIDPYIGSGQAHGEVFFPPRRSYFNYLVITKAFVSLSPWAFPYLLRSNM